MFVGFHNIDQISRYREFPGAQQCFFLFVAIQYFSYCVYIL